MAMTFHAIVGTRGHVSTPSVVVDKDTQDALSSTLETYANEIINAEHIAFDPGYRAEPGEIITITPYTLPSTFALLENAAVAADIPPVQASDLATGALRGLVGIEWKDAVPQRLVIQRVDARHLLRPERTRLFLAGGRFVTDSRPGLEIADRVDAVISDSTLYIASWTNAHAVLDLSQYMREATIAEAQDFLKHKKFAIDDGFKIEAVADSAVRRKITSIISNGVLDKCSVTQLSSYAAQFKMPVTVQKNKLLVPTEKRAFKDLLSLLDEDLLSFPPTQERWIVNSKRRARK